MTKEEQAIKEDNERIHAQKEAEDDYFDPDAHVCDYNWAGECQICGAIKYGSYLYRELYGGE